MVYVGPKVQKHIATANFPWHYHKKIEKNLTSTRPNIIFRTALSSLQKNMETERIQRLFAFTTAHQEMSRSTHKTTQADINTSAAMLRVNKWNMMN